MRLIDVDEAIELLSESPDEITTNKDIADWLDEFPEETIDDHITKETPVFGRLSDYI